MAKRLVIATGGTGGHLFPAMSLARRLRERTSDLEITFIGGKLASSSFFSQEQFDFREISCAPLLGLYKNVKGFQQSLSHLKQIKPSLVVGFGSYYGFPPLAAALFRRTPIVLFEPNAIPGKVVRWMAPFAKEIGVCLPNVSSKMRGQKRLVKMHTLKNERPSLSKEQTLKEYGLDPLKQTLLIFGGSQGAQRINELMLEVCHLWRTLGSLPINVLHFTGNDEFTEDLRRGYEEANVQAHVKTFEKEMVRAWSSADFLIARSGASTCAELIEHGVPALLIPYPFASDNHQEGNADFIVSLGGGVKINQKKLTSLDIAAAIERYLVGDISQKDMMKKKLCEYRMTIPKVDFADLVWNQLEEKK